MLDELECVDLVLSTRKWFQEFVFRGHQDGIRSLRASCAGSYAHSLRLSTGESINTVPMEVYFQPSSLVDSGGDPLQDGIGTLAHTWTQKDGSALGCALPLIGDDYREVWDKVTRHGFSGCRISMTIGPLDIRDPLWDVADRRQLFVTAYDISFAFDRPHREA